MQIDTETARRIAQLARIDIKEEALAPLAEELTHILAMMNQLNAVDVSNVAPLVSITPGLLYQRDDTVSEPDLQKDILKNAPDAREGFFVVPKVVE